MSVTEKTLLTRLRARSFDARKEALEALYELRSSYTAISARCLLSDSDWSVRSCAAEILGAVGSSQDSFALQSVMKDRSWVVRASAVASLAAIDKRSFVACTEMLKDRNSIVRGYAAIALADNFGNVAEPYLRSRLIREHAPRAKASLLRALIEIGDVDRIDDYLDLLQVSERTVKELVLRGLGEMIADGKIPPRKTHSVVSAVSHMSGSKDRLIAEAARGVLAQNSGRPGSDQPGEAH